ncbi:MAG: hypothetical protein CL599_19195 [Alteromonas sp.]|nr:hypothetical protein [Alteromonas sp.]|tara:strand:- start:21780 stop:21962 length:183 start_codon:yes stop_codon:yes gene_type:complete
MRVLGNDFNITDGLLNHLYKLYPNKLPLEQITSEEFSFLRGQQSVINKLIELQQQDFEED